MSNTILGAALPNIPWQDKPSGCTDAVWRYTQNPVIKRNAIPCSNSIFNSAVVPFEDGFAGVFRCDDKSRQMALHVGFSKDALHWDIQHTPISFCCDIADIAAFEYGYDPRVCFIEDRYYVTWCNGYRGMPTIGMAYTYDFKTFTQFENAYLPFNRNGVLFPRKIDGRYMMLNRPSDGGHTPFGDIYLSCSPDLTHWGEHRLVMKTGGGWESTKIGAGPIPIETTEGWLMIYHGVLCSCNGFVYSFGAAILDIDKPWIVKHRAKPYLMNPTETYELCGDVPNVVFPCATLCDADTGRIAIYYGAADTVVGLAFAQVDELIDFIKKNPR